MLTLFQSSQTAQLDSWEDVVPIQGWLHGVQGLWKCTFHLGMAGCDNDCIHSWGHHLVYKDPSSTTLPSRESTGFPLGRTNITSYVRLLQLSAPRRTEQGDPPPLVPVLGILYICSSLNHHLDECLPAMGSFPASGAALYSERTCQTLGPLHWQNPQATAHTMLSARWGEEPALPTLSTSFCYHLATVGTRGSS